MKKTRNQILGITETKNTGTGDSIIRNDNILFDSGVKQKQRAQAGVGCLILKYNADYLKCWEFVSERIIKVGTDISKDNYIEFIICYGSSENKTIGNRNKFWNDLQQTLDNCKKKYYYFGRYNCQS